MKKPQLTQGELTKLVDDQNINRKKFPLIVVGIRGYYRDSMGLPGVNDRGIYDDALFIDATQAYASFNGNTDPSRIRAGSGTGAAKGMASLNTGTWFVHKFDLHRGQYLALCQRAGDVTVSRDGKNVSYEDTGEFGINIHRGGYNSTSSEGCQTIHPDQWDSFIHLAVDLAKRYFGQKWNEVVIPYLLMDTSK